MKVSTFVGAVAAGLVNAALAITTFIVVLMDSKRPSPLTGSISIGLLILLAGVFVASIVVMMRRYKSQKIIQTFIVSGLLSTIALYLLAEVTIM